MTQQNIGKIDPKKGMNELKKPTEKYSSSENRGTSSRHIHLPPRPVQSLVEEIVYGFLMSKNSRYSILASFMSLS